MTSRNLSTVAQSQFVRFGVVGAFNTALSFGVYALGIYAGLTYYAASFVALVFGIGVSFVVQGKLVFQSRLKGRFPAFLAMWCSLYLLNIAIIRLLVTFDMSYYLAGLLATFPVVLLSFILQKFIVFKAP
ncbi:GtrA family protein [Erythrobacter sp. MTPC3]|uniref:GtrA family protein n=1 Tax=Erythrobacter sp. MTPC3 TaxID=3056564 RepID=UPI0036F2F098